MLQTGSGKYLKDAGAKLGIPGFDADVKFDNPGIPDFFFSGCTLSEASGAVDGDRRNVTSASATERAAANPPVIFVERGKSATVAGSV